MRFYNVEVKGKMMLEKRTSHPSYTADDIGRLYMCDGYMYLITDVNLGPSYVCSHIIYDGFSSDMRYGSLLCSNTWDGAQTVELTGGERFYINDSQPNASCSSLVVCRGSVGYTAAGCAVEVRTSHGDGIYSCSECCIAIKAFSVLGPAVHAITSCDHGVFGCSVNCYGVYGSSRNSIGGYFYTDAPFAAALRACTTGAFSVIGNTNYLCSSSKYIKYFENVCLSNCVREKPLSVYKYYWEDSNSKAFMQNIGPVAEDFDATFNVNNYPDKEEYEGLWTVDGAALGLSLENLKEIDKLKQIVVELYSCIKKLEAKEI